VLPQRSVDRHTHASNRLEVISSALQCLDQVSHASCHAPLFNIKHSATFTSPHTARRKVRAKRACRIGRRQFARVALVYL
jgi:hypothetical protein